MRNTLWIAAIIMAAAPGAAVAQSPNYGPRPLVVPLDVGVTGSVGGRAPWNRPWEYDSGSDNDRFPERPYYQQGRGQQTGGPSRNLLPNDGLQLVPR